MLGTEPASTMNVNTFNVESVTQPQESLESQSMKEDTRYNDGQDDQYRVQNLLSK